MNIKRIFWTQRILFLFLFTFLAVFFQQKVNKNTYSQNATISSKNTVDVAQEPQFQNISFIQGSGRLNSTLKPISEILEEKEEENKKNTPSLSSKIKVFNTVFCSYYQAFAKYFNFFFYESFNIYARLYSRICCWRI